MWIHNVSSYYFAVLLHWLSIFSAYPFSRVRIGVGQVLSVHSSKPGRQEKGERAALVLLTCRRLHLFCHSFCVGVWFLAGCVLAFQFINTRWFAAELEGCGGGSARGFSLSVWARATAALARPAGGFWLTAPFLDREDTCLLFVLRMHGQRERERERV